MLGKLTKYEFKATARVFLPFYLAVFGVTLVNKCFLLLNSRVELSGIMGTVFSLIGTLMMVVSIIMIAATIFLTFFMILQRFYKNLFTDEGYLMHTLPVKAGKHIFAKLIASSVWTLVSVLVVILAIFLLVVNSEVLDFLKDFFASLPESIEMFEKTLNTSFYGAVASAVIVVIISLPSGILTYYFAITLGSIILPKHKIGGAFIGYLLIYTVTQMVTGILLIIGVVISSNNIETIFKSSIPPSGFMYFCFGLTAFMNLIMGAISYLISVHIMQKKLNLE